jgi:membrane protein implicated in regulation of membrane protease activity
MPGQRGKSTASLLIFFTATIFVTALLLVDDLILYFLVENLFEMPPAPGLRLAMGGIFLLLNLGLLYLVFKSRQQKTQTGGEAMVGKIGEVTRVNGSSLWVKVHGELWRARCQAQVAIGTRVQVRSLDGLVLVVEPLA